MIASACSSRRNALRVSKSGSPGPAPTRYTFAVRATRAPEKRNRQQESRSYGARILFNLGFGSAVSLRGDARTGVPSLLAGKPVRFASEQKQCIGNTPERKEQKQKMFLWAVSQASGP